MKQTTKLKDYLKTHPNCKLRAKNVEMTFRAGCLVYYDNGDFEVME